MTQFSFARRTRLLRSLFVAFLALTGGWAGQPLQAQYYILGRGLDDQENPYAGATAELHGKDYRAEQQCTEQGVFRFNNLKPGRYELVLITAYGVRRKAVDLNGSVDITLTIPRNMTIGEISVVANRAGEKEPVTHDNLYAAEINRRDFGQDMPYIIENSPSVVISSDAGAGIGYTSLRLRGTDPTRINVTLNGVPINDAESHNVFWVDLPDLASSTTSIQIQRGIGWSQPGTGDFGGSIQLNTLGFEAEPYGVLKTGIGSFGSRRLTLGGGTGLVKGRFSLDGRASCIASDGYIDRAKSNLFSGYAMAGWHHDASNLRLLVAHGEEVTYQAWNGVPAQYIDVPELRTYNSAGTEKEGTPYANEIDDYGQTHVQLHLDKTITPFTRWVSALFYTRGSGYFEQYKADQALSGYGLDSATITDLVRQRWLDNHFYGLTTRIQVGAPGKRYFFLGGGWTQYRGRHFGKVIWIEDMPGFLPGRPYYDNEAVKRDANVFARSNMKITDALDLTLDLQGRWIHYAFLGPDAQGRPADQQVNHAFFNPKAGLRYVFSQSASIYLLSGINRKEPNRDDYVESTPASRPAPEMLWDTELGFRYDRANWRVEVVGYRMGYRDHLVPTGRLNDVGAYTRVNVNTCSRLGTEITMNWSGIRRLDLEAQASLSRNRIVEFAEYIDNWTSGEQEVILHRHTRLAFSPEVLLNLSGRYGLLDKGDHQLFISGTARYIGRQFADNTSATSARLDAYAAADFSLVWSFRTGKENIVTLKTQVRNAFNTAYESGGWTYRFRSPGFDPVPDDPYAVAESDDQYVQKGYYPQAGRNIWLQAEVKF